MASRRPLIIPLLLLAAGVSAAEPLQQAFDLRVPQAPVAVAVDGAQQVVYELHLTSYADTPLVLRQVDVLDKDAGTLVWTFRDDELADRLHVAARAADARGLGPGTAGVVYLELLIPDGDLPRALEHRIRFDTRADDPGTGTVTGGSVSLQDEFPVRLSPPVSGGPWVAIYDPSWTRGHRRVIYAVNGRAKIPGRFAIDWILLDRDGRPARGDQDVVHNWYGHGADVLAVADGVIAATRDDVAESTTVSGHQNPALEDATGNYVALDLGGGRFAFYEHLRPGSVRVEPGQQVSRGEVLGSLGFTGSSTGPHLHFHVADANSPLDAEGLPFVLDRFRVLGHYDDFGRLGPAPWTPLEDRADRCRTAELPASNVVIEFRGVAAPGALSPPEDAVTIPVEQVQQEADCEPRAEAHPGDAG